MATKSSLSTSQQHNTSTKLSTQQRWIMASSIRTAQKLSMSHNRYYEYLSDWANKNPAVELVEDDGSDNIERVDDITSEREMTPNTNLQEYYQQVFEALDSQTCIGRPTHSNFNNDDDDEPKDLLSTRHSEQTFTEYLQDQILTDDNQLRSAIEFLIFSLDDHGFLKRTLDELSYDFVEQLFDNYTTATLQQQYEMEDEALRLLKEGHQTLLTFEPHGVGTTNFQECLLMQLNTRKRDEIVDCAINIVTHYYTRFMALGGRYDTVEGTKFAREICREFDITPADYIEVLKEIKSCNPIPSAGFSNQQVSQMPDFFVKVLEDDRIMVVQNFGRLPRIRRTQDSSEILKQSQDKRSEEFHHSYQKSLQEVDNELLDFKMRNTALMQVMLGIVKMQRQFFITGDRKDIVPCTRHSLHNFINENSHSKTKVISYFAVSRAAKDRFFAFEDGVFPLSMFFGSKIETENGSKSKAFVKERILELIKDENGKLLSDQKIADKLTAEGMKIARRTVAKYRKELKIEKNYKSEKRTKNTTKKRSTK
ncbi:MAG: hypothetical protein Q4D14_01730 [Bacteroidales bacterium]|nr:hypothetical protein [Bacteroidales bacterium]